ncbi:MAG: asparagine synthase (glutamine-hydrolyzing) [Candidatus Jordarchaeum sp.]|uniref:asparagine synthase (glutamine-hydrolyzing) n=1 Tax=Candidatus Jordarchaeum sp. TaxID=2823881 RepID=UPI00404B18AE
MCGIAGIFNPNGKIHENSLQILREMGDVLSHRGPDDYGEYRSPSCGLVFRRLSIIDLERGHQPMLSASRSSVIVFNGEIYNFKELRKDLEAEGCTFLTNSDTEVILNGYEKWETDIIHRLRGIFAFVLYDIPKDKLFVARDHTGIKPLYYTLYNGQFVFASEIKAILKYPGIKASLNVKCLPQFLSFLWVPAPNTLFDDILILEPGTMMQVDADGTQKKRYWTPDLSTQDDAKSEKDWIEIIDSELRRTVSEQMISDVPLGAFLSGGVDSSTIVALMNDVSDEPVTTYSIGFNREDLRRDVIRSDLKYARLAANILNVNYNEIVVKPEVTSLLEKLIWHMDEPLPDPAAITTFLVCNAAKEKCSVMLSGVGGDEIFGGYPRYLANRLADNYHKVPAFIRNSLVAPLVRGLPIGSSRSLRNLKKFLKSADLPFEERYFGYLSYYSKEELTKLLRKDFDWSEIFLAHRQVYENYKATDDLQFMMNLDLMTFLPYLNLMYTDKMSSAAAVEVRVPYLDHLLIEKVSRIPCHFKINGKRQKYILKKVAQKYLPNRLVWRKKAGFGAPIGAWIKDQAKEMMLDLLSEETIKRRGYFNYPFVFRLIKNHLDEKEYNANQLWQLMAFEIWHRIFLG